MTRTVFNSKIHRATVTQTVVLVDERNRVTARGAMEVPGPARRAG